MNTKATILDLDEMMDMDMDAVETLPDYVTPGKSLLILGIAEVEVKKGKNKEGEEKSSIVITYEIKDTVESEEPAFPNGSRFTERFTGTEDGIKYFKKQAMKILNVKSLEGAKMRDVMDGLKSLEAFKAAITTRTTKDDATGKEYTNINIRPLHETPAS